jgi:hypothetical protein
MAKDGRMPPHMAEAGGEPTDRTGQLPKIGFIPRTPTGVAIRPDMTVPPRLPLDSENTEKCLEIVHQFTSKNVHNSFTIACP